MSVSIDLQNKELLILRNAVDLAAEKIGKKLVESPQIKYIIEILEDFLRDKKLICYGGTAINNILPDNDKFYNKNVEIPDYDFFSKNALEDAKHLADIYYKLGFEEVEAKSGVHFGTYKVYVNFIPIADITQINNIVYNILHRDAIKIDDIYIIWSS